MVIFTMEEGRVWQGPALSKTFQEINAVQLC